MDRAHYVHSGCACCFGTFLDGIEDLFPAVGEHGFYFTAVVSVVIHSGMVLMFYCFEGDFYARVCFVDMLACADLHAAVIVFDNFAMLEAVEDDLEGVIEVRLHAAEIDVDVDGEEVSEHKATITALDIEGVLVALQGIALYQFAMTAYGSDAVAVGFAWCLSADDFFYYHGVSGFGVIR